MTRRLVSAVLAAVLTAIALWFLLTPEILAELRTTFMRANWWTLGFAVLLSGSVQWLRALRFEIMRTGAVGLPDARLVRIAFQLNFFNFVLPFRLGEISYPVLMHRAYGESMLKAAGILLVARLLDLSTVGAVLLGAVAWLDVAGSGVANALLGSAAIALAVLPIALVVAGRAALKFAERRSAGRLTAVGAWFDARHTLAARAAVVGLSFGIWLTFGALAILTTHAVLVPMSPAVALLGASATNLAFALPINGIAGLGPSQAAWAAAVNLAGITWDAAVISAFALHAIVLGSALLFGGIAMLGESAWSARAASPRSDTRRERIVRP